MVYVGVPRWLATRMRRGGEVFTLLDDDPDIDTAGHLGRIREVGGAVHLPRLHDKAAMGDLAFKKCRRVASRCISVRGARNF